MPQFLLSEKTSYNFSNYVPSSIIDWVDQSIAHSQQQQNFMNKNTIEKKPKQTKWHQMNSLVVERQESHHLSLLAPENHHHHHHGLTSLGNILKNPFDDDISDTLKNRVTDAVQKKKERPRIENLTNIFHSMSPAHNGQSNDDKDDTDDNVTASMTLPPSARKILKQRKKKQASIMPEFVTRNRGYSLERGLDMQRKHNKEDRHWRMSASPVLQPGLDASLVRSKRLDRIALCHHIPRVKVKQDDKVSMTSLIKKIDRVSISPRSRDSGQASMTDVSDDISDEGNAVINEDEKIVHRYIASRGQRERETDIYEVNPPPSLFI